MLDTNFIEYAMAEKQAQARINPDQAAQLLMECEQLAKRLAEGKQCTN